MIYNDRVLYEKLIHKKAADYFTHIILTSPTPPPPRFKPPSVLVGLGRLQHESRCTRAWLPQEYFNQHILSNCICMHKPYTSHVRV